MNFAKFLAAMEAAVPTVGQIVTILHPENVGEGVKIAAGVQLFQMFAAGVHAVMSATAEAPATDTQAPAAPAATGAPAPNV